MLEGVVGQIEDLSTEHPILVYGIIAVSAFLENVVPPVPGDTVVIFSAYVVGRGALDWLPVYMATCTGGSVGFMVMYYLGFNHGRAALDGFVSRYLKMDQLTKAERWLERYGSWLVLANRFLSGIRSVIALSAGMGRMSWQRVAGFGLISMLLWNGLLLYAGLLVGENWESVVQFLQAYNTVALAVIALVAFGFGVRWWCSKGGASS